VLVISARGGGTWNAAFNNYPKRGKIATRGVESVLPFGKGVKKELFGLTNRGAYSRKNGERTLEGGGKLLCREKDKKKGANTAFRSEGGLAIFLLERIGNEAVCSFEKI